MPFECLLQPFPTLNLAFWFPHTPDSISIAWIVDHFFYLGIWFSSRTIFTSDVDRDGMAYHTCISMEATFGFHLHMKKERGLGPLGQRDVDFDNGCNDSFISFMLFFNVLGNLVKCHGR